MCQAPPRELFRGSMGVLDLDGAGSYLSVEVFCNPFDRRAKTLREELLAQTGETVKGTDDQAQGRYRRWGSHDLENSYPDLLQN